MRSPIVAKAVIRYPKCVDIILPLWATMVAEGSPPIWTNVPVSMTEEDKNDATKRFEQTAVLLPNIKPLRTHCN